jgi:hypothetical protein
MMETLAIITVIVVGTLLGALPGIAFILFMWWTLGDDWG